jgi:hypothetical protein
MKKTIYYIVIFLSVFVEMNAQTARTYADEVIPGKTWIIASAGPVGILPKDVLLDYSNPLNNKTITVGFRHLFPTNLGYKASVHYTTFAGTNSTGAFTSSLYQGSFQAEYMLIGGYFATEPSRNNLTAFAGAGYNYNNSSTGGTPLFVKYFPSVFTGLGYERNVTNRITLGVDLTISYLFTPYLAGIYSFASSSTSIVNNKPVTTTLGISNNITPSIEFTMTYNIDRVPKHGKDCNCDWDWGF